MNIKVGILVLTLFVGSWAYPKPEDDLSIFFEHVDPESRIVGGTQAATGSHPHMVALTTGTLIRSYLCGGSLITVRSVLTAAHCINHVFSGGSLSSTLRAVVGTNRWNSGGTTLSLARNITHPNYVQSTIKNDIGILILSSQAPQSNLVRVLPLSFDFIPQGVNTRVAGWGRTRANGAISATLMEVTLTTIEGNDCARRVAQAAINFNIRAPPVEPHIELCAFRAANFGTCNGDSGSPLVRIDRGQQIGIVSWGFPCARGAPDMFVRVSAYQNWVRQNAV